ncbi:hypothetical protein D3C87_1064540 [compost metagenome]
MSMGKRYTYSHGAWLRGIAVEPAVTTAIFLCQSCFHMGFSANREAELRGSVMVHS